MVLFKFHFLGQLLLLLRLFEFCFNSNSVHCALSPDAIHHGSVLFTLPPYPKLTVLLLLRHLLFFNVNFNILPPKPYCKYNFLQFYN